MTPVPTPPVKTASPVRLNKHGDAIVPPPVAIDAPTGRALEPKERIDNKTVELREKLLDLCLVEVGSKNPPAIQCVVETYKAFEQATAARPKK